MTSRRSLLVAASAATLALPQAIRAQSASAQSASTPAAPSQPAASQRMPEAGRRAWADQISQIRIGLLGGENESDRLGRYGRYGKLIEETFQVPVRLYPAADYAGVIQAFGARQIEMAGLGSSAYAAAWMDTSGNVEPLFVAEELDGSIAYHSVLVARKDSGVATLEQAKGKSLAWADPNSTSGYLIPRFELRAAGIGVEPGQYFSRTGFGGGHEQAVVAVLNKQYDVAATWVSGQGDPAQGYSRGNLSAMVSKGLLNMADLNVVWMSKPILNGPMTVRKDLPDAFKQDVKAFHLALPSQHPDIYKEIERGGGTGYRPVRHEDFQLFIDMRREEQAARRRS